MTTLMRDCSFENKYVVKSNHIDFHQLTFFFIGYQIHFAFTLSIKYPDPTSQPVMDQKDGCFNGNKCLIDKHCGDGKCLYLNGAPRYPYPGYIQFLL